MYICKIQMMFVKLSEQTLNAVYKNLLYAQAQNYHFSLSSPSPSLVHTLKMVVRKII